MAERSRYNVSVKGSGIDGGILKNKLGIKDQATLDDAETLLLADAYKHFFDRLNKEGLHFNLPLLFEIHKFFLGPLYSWAGKKRRINISKDNVLFAPIEYLVKSLEEFEQVLIKNIPTLKDTKKILAKKFALIHDEFNTIHPFREGNGRTIRLLLDLMAAYVGYDPIDWDKVKDEVYINACKQGMICEHLAMEKIIYKGLTKKKES